MKKKVLICACLGTLALLFTGCGSQAEVSSPGSAVNSAGSVSSAAAEASSSSSWEPSFESGSERVPNSSIENGAEEGQGGLAKEKPDVTEYTLDRDVSADARTLSLRLHGRVDTTDGFERIGISAIDVLDEDTLLQTISIGEAFDQLYRELGLEDWVGQYQWTDCWTEDGSLATDDLNFDGYPDLRLMAAAGVVNISYLCWLWDNESGQFHYAFELVGYDVLVDAESKQLVTESRGDAGNYYTDYYRYDNDLQSLVHLKEIHVSAEAVGGVYEVHELIDGEWLQTQ